MDTNVYFLYYDNYGIFILPKMLLTYHLLLTNSISSNHSDMTPGGYIGLTSKCF